MGDDDISYDFNTANNLSQGITINTSDFYDSNSITVSLDSVLDTSDLTYTFDTTTYNREFIDTMPSVYKIEDMCKEYPALKSAYENFQRVYNLVKDDYAINFPDDEIPF